MQPRPITLEAGADLAGFRRSVRLLLAEQRPPEAVIWTPSAAPSLFNVDAAAAAPPVVLPRSVNRMVEAAVLHRDPARYALLYELIWRVSHGERSLLDVSSDPVVHRLERMAKAIRRDLHKMHAFLRFRRVEGGGGDRFVAWFEPDHYILEAAATFFVERFAGMVWSILTPLGSLHWDRHDLTIGGPSRREDAPQGDPFEAGWRGYYESTFNPARVNPGVMRGHMAKKYWKNLPETEAIAHLVQTAPSRVEAMIEQAAATPAKRNPDRAVAAMADQNPRSLADLNRIITAAHPLVPGATRAVLGEGPIGASIAFVGEQPGDQEDLAGRPFVGPAGQLLTRALTVAGIDRRAAYFTNAVKHFKFVQRGKRRLHQSPTAGEVSHYRWWLERELSFVNPAITVALGATAALALTGEAVTITKARGTARFGERKGFITVHPAYLLRLPDEGARADAYQVFLDDLRRIRELARTLPARRPAA
jgi:probable DNA metabolism protein